MPGEEDSVLLDRFRLDDKVALVTGAGRGIGEGIALAFAELGAQVVCTARTQSEIDDAALQICNAGGQALALRCDVTKDEEIGRLVDDVIGRLGQIDIVVNNAGGGGHGKTLELDDDFMIETLRLNLMAAVHVSRRVIPHMQAGEGGSIVNISSGLSRIVDNGALSYGSAKAALEHATRMLAFEFAPEVRVNAIRCGAVLTPDIEKSLFSLNPRIRPWMEEMTPMARIGTPEDIALAALYLASDASSFITGKILDVDGGQGEATSSLALFRTLRRHEKAAVVAATAKP
jgi:7-alpha-hydroxysteroid dehydrogenase